MAETDLIIPIVVAVIGLLGSLISLLFSWRSQKSAHKLSIQLTEVQTKLEQQQIVSNLENKYGQPLIVAAYDLQQRLFELVEYPISRQHLEKPEGLDDLKIFTCYLLAQYLVAAYILRTKTAYLSFSMDNEVKETRNIMYMIDEELDRRRDAAGMNIGVWPAARILICERMILNSKDVNNALDGGFGVDVKGFNQFHKEWDKDFKVPMGYFCETIDMMLDGRINPAPYSDAALRVLQHLLVDLVKRLDKKEAYVTEDPEDMKCKESSRGCDCDGINCQPGVKTEKTLRDRQGSRLGDVGLWACNGKHQTRLNYKDYNPTSDKKITLKEVKKMTHYINLA